MPSPQLFGNLNYNLYSPGARVGCEVLTAASVAIEVLEDIVAVPVAPSVGGQQSNGIAFQFNCLPLSTQSVTTWQQYIIALSRTGQQLGWWINNWNAAGGEGFVNFGGNIALIPSDLPAGYAHLPAGYTLGIALQIDQISHNAIGAIFSLSFKGQPMVKPISIDIAAPGRHNALNGKQLTTADLSPIADVTLDIVGYANSANTLLTSGAGQMTYIAEPPVVTAVAIPNCVYDASDDDETAESSNITYGELPAGPSTTFTQTFACQPALSYIVVEAPGAALDLYSQPIGTGGWAKQEIAGPGSAYSPPALTFANFEVAPWIAVQGPQNSLVFYYRDNSHWSNEQVAAHGTTFSAPSIAQHGTHICIAAVGPDNSLMVYWQQIDGSGWQGETAAPAGSAFSIPALAPIENGACIAVQGPNHSLQFYWQTLDGPGGPGLHWFQETVAGPDTTFSAPSLAQVGGAACVAAKGPGKLNFYSWTIGVEAWSQPETVAVAPFAYSAPSLVQIGNSACIAAQSPFDTLSFYWQTIGSQEWHPETVANENTTFSAPALAQIGNSSCIVAQGAGDSLTFYWQTIGTGKWTPELVADSATVQPGSLSIGPPLAPLGG